MKPRSAGVPYRRWVVALVGAGIVGGFLLAYRPLALDMGLQQLFRQSTSVARIQTHRGLDLEGTVVFVSGTVGDRAPLIGADLYELQQGTHSIWILTTQPGVQVGDRVRVRARIRRESFEQNGATSQEYYLQEIWRR